MFNAGTDPRLEWQPGIKRFERFVLGATVAGFLSLYLASRWSCWDSHPFTWRSPRIPSSKAGPVAMPMATFVVRTLLEDGALRRELPGYEEYCTRTRYRLAPGVW